MIIDYANLKEIMNYLLSDLFKKQRTVKIGFCSIFLVVFFISILMTAIALSPTLIIRLSEDQIGETDIIMIPYLNKEDVSKKPSSFDRLLLPTDNTFHINSNETDFQLKFLDFTQLSQQLKMEPYLTGIVPRWIFQANTTTVFNDVTTWAFSNVLIINSLLENKYGMGRSLSLPELSEETCYISESLYKSLKMNLTENDKIKINISLIALLRAMINFKDIFKFNPKIQDHKEKQIIRKTLERFLIQSVKEHNIPFGNRVLSEITESDNNLDEYFTFTLNLKIKAIIPTTSGKWPAMIGNVVAIDSRFGKLYLQENLMKIVKKIGQIFPSPKVIEDALEIFVNKILCNFSLENYALTVNAIIQNKFDLYQGTQSFQRREVSKITGKIIQKLGYDYPVKMKLPIYEVFKVMEIGKVYFENICSSVMFLLSILSTILIYSLMLGNVDEKTYEFGMLRSLGFQKSNLILMILFQAFIFSIPAVILALISCYVLNVIISYYLFDYSGLFAPFYISTATLFWSIFIGLSIPLISSYLPIKKALSANLKDALTIFNKKLGDIYVHIVKLENLGISPTSLVSSIILIAIGFSTYYIAPLSFFLLDYSIFLFIMNLILIVMLLGLIVLLQLVVPKLQRYVVKGLMLIFYPDRNIHFVVIKNLQGHARRNDKTSIMYTIALSFIIFSGCTLHLVTNFIVSATKNYFGGDILVWQFGNNKNQDTLNENLLSEYLQRVKKHYPQTIKNYTYLSYSLQDILFDRTTFSSLSGYPEKTVDVLAVDQNVINSGFSELYMYSEYNHTLNFTLTDDLKHVDIVSGLFLNDNVEKIIPQQDSRENVFFPNPNSVNTLDMEFRAIVPEGLRRPYAVDLDNPGMIQLTINNLHQKVPLKIVALMIKLAGLPAFSSYYTIADYAPILISTNQMEKLIKKEMELDHSIYDKLINSPAFSMTPNGIRKKFLIIKFFNNVTTSFKEMVNFELRNIIDNENTQSILVTEIIEAAQKAAQLMEYFYIIVGLIALILAFFLIWISFYSNIKDNITEYGIMRAIGINKSKSMRIYLYEAVAIISASIIVGTAIGVIIACTLILQFNIFSELPFQFAFPYRLYCTMVLCGIALGLLGSFYPTYQVNRLSLVKIMKGILD